MPSESSFDIVCKVEMQEDSVIVLSGGNHDGAAGLQAIVRAGGLAVVQSPEQAAVDIMPRAAIAAGSVDYVLPLDQIAELLAAL